MALRELQKDDIKSIDRMLHWGNQCMYPVPHFRSTIQAFLDALLEIKIMKINASIHASDSQALNERGEMEANTKSSSKRGVS